MKIILKKSVKKLGILVGMRVSLNHRRNKQSFTIKTYYNDKRNNQIGFKSKRHRF